MRELDFSEIAGLAPGELQGMLEAVSDDAFSPFGAIANGPNVDFAN